VDVGEAGKVTGVVTVEEEGVEAREDEVPAPETTCGVTKGFLSFRLPSQSLMLLTNSNVLASCLVYSSSS
jgi:hypothetical protein